MTSYGLLTLPRINWRLLHVVVMRSIEVSKQSSSIELFSLQ
jgi:hypothetical protein